MGQIVQLSVSRKDVIRWCQKKKPAFVNMRVPTNSTPYGWNWFRLHDGFSWVLRNLQATGDDAIITSLDVEGFFVEKGNTRTCAKILQFVK